jgi:hypothetical protein
MRLRHAIALIGISIAGCSDPGRPADTETSEPGTIDQAPASYVPSAETAQALARLGELQEAITNAELDQDIRLRVRNVISQAAEDIYACEYRGDRIVTNDQHTWCNDVYSDGGKVCSDSSECEGLCEVEGGARAGAEITGICEAEEGDAICSAIIARGVVSPMGCPN